MVRALGERMMRSTNGQSIGKADGASTGRVRDLGTGAGEVVLMKCGSGRGWCSTRNDVTNVHGGETGRARAAAGESAKGMRIHRSVRARHERRFMSRQDTTLILEADGTVDGVGLPHRGWLAERETKSARNLATPCKRDSRKRTLRKRR